MLESREGPETCNTYNMLRLTEQLFRASPRARLRRLLRARAVQPHPLDAASRSTAATSTSRRSGRGTTASTRSRRRASGAASARAWRTTASTASSSTPTAATTSCSSTCSSPPSSTWPERRPDAAAGDGVPRRAAHAPGRSRWRRRARSRCRSGIRRGSRPARSASASTARPWPARIDAGVLRRRSTREWRDGDRVEIDLPMRTTLERLPDGSGLRRDPARADPARGARPAPSSSTGSWPDRRPHGAHVAGAVPAARRRADAGRRCGGAGRSHRAGAGASADVHARPASIRPAAARDLELVPFFRVHDSRYMIYWRVATPEGYERVVTELRESERARLRARGADARSRDAGRAAERRSITASAATGRPPAPPTAGPSAMPPAGSPTT